MNLDKKKALYLRARKKYDNDPDGDQLMTDAEFDALEDAIRAVEPDWAELHKTGSDVADKKTECDLPRFMPSLNKRYPEKLAQALAKRADIIVLLDKLDGSALLAGYEPDPKVKNQCIPTGLWTRGNGTRGGDISFLLPHLSLSLPIVKGHTKPFFLRCEAVMKAKKFAAHHSSKANARGVVNGALNRMTKSKALADTDIVVLGVYGMPLVEGLRWAWNEGFSVVKYTVVRKQDAFLSDHLARRRAKSVYAIDGIVVADAMQMFDYKNADKPKHSFAYKENTDLANAPQTTVLSIVWQTSRKKVLVPKINIEPVVIDGSTINYATAHNAQWMLDKGLGKGAVVQIVKSGDVIPKIVNVIKKVKPSLPTVPYTQVGVHFVANDASKESECKVIHKFFTTLGIEFIALRTIEDLYDLGFTTSLDYVEAWATKSWRKNTVAALGSITSSKILREFERVFAAGLNVDTLMVASNCFAAGLGERRLSMVRDALGNNYWYKFWVDWRNRDDTASDAVLRSLSRNIVKKTDGWSDKTVKLVFDGMPAFCSFMQSMVEFVNVSQRKKPSVTAVKVDGPLTGIVFSFTGYRDAAQEQALTSKGGTVVPFSAKTQVLFYRDKGKRSSKVDTAKARGTEVAVYEIYMKKKG